MNEDWSDYEVELIVADYFSMLSDELRHIAINKTEHRKNLMAILNNRSHGSIEFKHQNISAALAEMGMPFIRGYKPRFNFQRSKLGNQIANYLQANPILETYFASFATDAHTSNLNVDFTNWVVSPPEKNTLLNEERPSFNPVKVNYLEREQYNRNLGLKGEELALNYEREILISSGKENLATKVEWVSKDQGDGLGFDILSKNLNGSDKYIEVKTTKLPKETPFYFTSNELLFSIRNATNFHLYRIYDFSIQPKMFNLSGRYDRFCNIIPVQYKGVF